MRIAVNRGFGGITAKSANVQPQIRIRGAGRRGILTCSKQAPGLWLDSLRKRPSVQLPRPGCLVHAKRTGHERR